MDTFEVKWNSNNKISGKVFKKRKAKIPLETPKISHESQNKQTNNISEKIDTEKVVPGSQELIKRKRKKLKNGNDPNIESNANASKHHSLFSEKYKSVYINTRIKGASVVEKVFSADRKFSDLDIHKHLVSNLEKNDFSILTNVQDKAIPPILDKQNVLIRSQTGSGKTLVYCIPILNALVNITPRIQRNDGVKTIIVVPTRELVIQTFELFQKLNTFQWIVVGYLCGGESRVAEKRRLRKGIHVLIGTPGRLLDHILHTCSLNLNNVSCLVLDEADRLLDMGFKKDIVRLVEELNAKNDYNPMELLKRNTMKIDGINKEEENKNRQSILLSATLNEGVADLADFIMKEHTYIDALESVSNPKHMIIPNTVNQHFLITFVKHRLVVLSALLISKTKQPCKIFVFMATTQMVEYHYDLFKNCLMKMSKYHGKMKYQADFKELLESSSMYNENDEVNVLDFQLFKLHGSMNQNDRKQIFGEFRKAKKGVLLCTDVAARGLDVPEADCIIQYTGPTQDEDYLHRVGRTGRAGKSGSAIIFLTHEEQEFVSHLQDYKVFLKEYNLATVNQDFLEFMNESEQEQATISLQKHYEESIYKDEELHKKACSAYSSWARFYSGLPMNMRKVFNFKKVNLGHYVTSFGLKEKPTDVAGIAKRGVMNVVPKKLNKKLANHEEINDAPVQNKINKKVPKSICLTMSEFGDGLEPTKKKLRKK